MRYLFILIFLSGGLSLCAQAPLEEDPLSDRTLDRMPFFTSVKKAIKNPAEAYKLSLINTGLTEIPSEVFQLTELRVLILDSNKLTKIPDEIGNLTRLRELSLSDNEITVIPPAIAKLENLRTLYLSGNNIRELPPALFSLRQLVYLMLGGNQIKVIPENIGKLKELRALWMPHNEIETLPVDIGHLYNLAEISLVNNKLKTLPDEFFLLTNLVNLYLGQNQLTEISDRLGNLKNLDKLGLNDNQLKKLPSTIGQLGELKTLFVLQNQLETFPPQIGDMVKLEDIYAGENPLKDLPKEMLLMQKLETLDLEKTTFTSFPQILYDLNNNGVKITGYKGKELYNVKLLISKGNNMNLTGDYEGARGKFLEVLQLDTNNAAAMLGLAEAYLELSNYDSTVVLCEKALKKNPPAELIGKIKTVQLKGENHTNSYDALAAAYVTKTKESPGEAQPFCELGVFNYNLGKFKEAKNSLLNAVKLKPNYADAHFYLAVVMLSMDEDKPFVYQTLRFLSLEPRGTRAESILPFMMTRMKMRVGKMKGTTTTYNDDFIIRDENNQMVYKSKEPMADITTAMIADLSMSFKAEDKEDEEFMNKVMKETFKTGMSNNEIFISEVKELVAEDTVATKVTDEKEKEKITENTAFFKNYYKAYLQDMISKGHLETFAYIVTNLREEEASVEWIKTHPTEIKAFKAWTDGFKWE